MYKKVLEGLKWKILQAELLIIYRCYGDTKTSKYNLYVFFTYQFLKKAARNQQPWLPVRTLVPLNQDQHLSPYLRKTKRLSSSCLWSPKALPQWSAFSKVWSLNQYELKILCSKERVFLSTIGSKLIFIYYIPLFPWRQMRNKC